MIIRFGNKLAMDLFEDRPTKETRNFPQELYRVARRKLQYLDEADTLQDLKIPPGNKLKPLGGSRIGYFSIRINDQWRITFQFEKGNASNVSVEDYH